MSAERRELELTVAQAAERIRGRRPVGATSSSTPTARRRPATRSTPSCGAPSPGRRTARAAERRRRSAGIPIAVKDIFCTEGIPTTAGSRILEGYRPPYTATAVRRLREAGAQRARQDEHGRVRDGLVERELRLRPGRNPWDPGGCRAARRAARAAAVAGRLAPCAIGTDTGGSIRQPASLCGIVGMKPTYGAISRYGMIAFASSLDQCGPLTRDVTDAALLLQRRRARPAATRPRSASRTGSTLPAREDLSGLRFGVPREFSATPRGSSPASPRSSSAPDADRGARRRGRRDRAPARAARHLRLLRDRAGRGVGEPGALRRRPLRAARDGRRPDRDVRAHPRGRDSAPRSSAGSCSAPTRSPPATTTPTTGAPRGCGRRSPRTSRPPSSAST